MAFVTGTASAYDPLAARIGKPESVTLEVYDKQRQRNILLRVYMPDLNSAAPVVLFSHGLGGSRDGSTFLGKHWALRGYVAVFLQHPGSDDSVWKQAAPGDRMNAMRKAINLENFMLRARDVPAVLDQLERWNTQTGHLLYRKLDMARTGMSGHSFGAVTTQAVSGQMVARGMISLTEPRIKAAIVLSPSSPAQAREPSQAFGNVRIPWMLMTGTRDIAVLGAAEMKLRLAVFPALPAGGKYELVLYDAEHSVFTDRPLPGETAQRNPNHHRAILALSTAFWDAWLRADGAARAWLDGDGPLRILERQDRWQRK
jgi:predicted dienelactone hydrolase